MFMQRASGNYGKFFRELKYCKDCRFKFERVHAKEAIMQIIIPVAAFLVVYFAVLFHLYSKQ